MAVTETQEFDGQIFRCGDARQRLPDGRWLPCPDVACSGGTVQGRFLVVPVLDPVRGFVQAVFRRRLIVAPAPDQRWAWEAVS